jgi:ubiquinone/menaquinone biosynthesis C-methylase UbiE
MEWFKSWFNKDYTDLYSYRDVNEAKDQISFLFSLAELSKLDRDDCILDVACGAGRHLYAMIQQGRNAFGIDLSKELLRTSWEHIEGKVVQGDMRFLPFGDSQLSLVTCLFTSFGYFVTEADELQVLHEIRRVLKERGLFVIDVANKEHVISTLVPQEVISYSEGTAAITRSIHQLGSQTRVKKHIELEKEDNQVAHHVEDVHLFDKDELSALLIKSGFKIVDIFGGFSDEAYHRQSERLIIVCIK